MAENNRQDRFSYLTKDAERQYEFLTDEGFQAGKDLNSFFKRGIADERQNYRRTAGWRHGQIF